MLSVALFSEAKYLGIIADSLLPLTSTSSILASNPVLVYQNTVHSTTAVVQASMSAYIYGNGLLTGFPASLLLTSHLWLMVYLQHNNLSGPLK